MINKKKRYRWLKVLAILYFIIGIALYVFQERFLFHPKPYTKDHVYKFTLPFKEINIAVNKKDTINVVQFLPEGTERKGIVVYYHGNMDNIEHYADYAKVFTRHGYEVWMEDYPGFGKSTGERTETALYQQAMEVYRMAQQQMANDSIIVYGKSFGTGIAAYVAAQQNNKQLILETPYSSIPGLFDCYAPIYPTKLMSTFSIPSYQYLQQVHYPITIFHGTDDGVIPYRCAAQLKKVLKKDDAFIAIPGGTHHNLYGFAVYQKTMDSILSL